LRPPHNEVRLPSQMLPFLKPGGLLEGASTEHFPPNMHEV
jgi:hypothetical protein